MDLGHAEPFRDLSVLRFTVNKQRYSPAQCFQQALMLDPGLPLAWYGLAQAGGGVVDVGGGGELFDRSKCFQKVLELAPQEAKEYFPDCIACAATMTWSDAAGDADSNGWVCDNCGEGPEWGGFAHYCGLVNGGGSACLATKTSAENVDMAAVGKHSMDIDWAWDNAIA